jgi:uncharacterized protein
MARQPSPRFLAAPASASILAILLLASCASSFPLSLETRRYVLGRDPEPLRIVQVSDFHARLYSSLDAELARRVREIGPDLILITGDTVTKKADYAVAERIISGFGDDIPKLAVRGNWDLSTDADPGGLAAILSAHGGRLLVNEYALVEIRGAKLLVYGGDDMLSGDYRPPLAAELGKRVEESGPRAVFLLCHEPAFVDSLDKDILSMEKVFAFSGHTHGGQVTFFGAAIPAVMPALSGRYVSGEYRVGSLRLFVSRGVGTSRIDLRFMARPDLMVSWL